MGNNLTKSIHLISHTFFGNGYRNEWKADFKSKCSRWISLAWPNLKMLLLKHCTSSIPVQLLNQTCWIILQIILQISWMHHKRNQLWLFIDSGMKFMSLLKAHLDWHPVQVQIIFYLGTIVIPMKPYSQWPEFLFFKRNFGSVMPGSQ